MTDAADEKPVAQGEPELDEASERSIRAALKAALRDDEAPPDVLSGFQRKVRERSRGKFYADGWSTSRHAPVNTYLITSLLMLAVLIVVYVLLSPLSGAPEPVKNEPKPVQLIPGQKAP
jgi:hypothetical protein